MGGTGQGNNRAIARFWDFLRADELKQCRDEMNAENRLAIRLLAIVGVPLSLANTIVQTVLSNDANFAVIFLRTSWVLLYFLVLLVVERWVVPKDFSHATELLYVVEVPVLVCSILLGSVWDPSNQAITFLLFIMAVPAFVLDRPIRVLAITAAWTVLFIAACYAVKPPEIFQRDLMHAFEFLLASLAVASVVIRIRMVSLRNLQQANYNLEHDELTGTRNWLSLNHSSEAYLGKRLVVMASVLDQLNMYSDFYGHDVGNRVLIRFVEVLSRAFGEEHVYRYRGDDVFCIAEGIPEEECLAKMRECRMQLDEFQAGELQRGLTFACGYVMGTPESKDELLQMFRLADIYAHIAAKRGRDETMGGVFDEGSLRAGIVESNVDTHVRSYETNQLTGLPSMSFFITSAEEALAGIVNYDRNPMVGFLCLAHMKSFNSEFGYAQGDELIRHTADLLREAFPKRLLCCITGSQFGVLCYEDEIEPGMRVVSEGLDGYKDGYTIVFKAGFAAYESGERCISLLDKARAAERSIHGDGGASVRYYDDQLDEDIKLREYVIAHVDAAIERGYLEVHYQPIVDTETSVVCNHEALSRWNDPVRGMLAPFQFIPALEESRQVYKLSLHVVRRVLADFRAKRDMDVPLVPVSVNLSRHDFEQCDMVSEITKLVDESGFPRNLICIEITESAFMKNQELLKREVARFRLNGFQVWMDDFGSEYSTLNLLQELDFDLIKLDMRFMSDLSDSGKNLVIVSSIIGMAKRMGMGTLAEGVETEEHLKALRVMGCDKLQGFLFSRPLPLDEFATWMASRQPPLPADAMGAGEQPAARKKEVTP